jgi:hypothetical protein
MKKIFLAGLLLSFLIAASGCGIFKKKCNCPHFEAKAQKM